MRLVFALILLVGLTSVLAGCSREPSATDIEKMMRADAAESKNVVLHEVRKVGCAPAQGSPGYMCDVEVDATVTQPIIFGRAIQLPRKKTTVKIRIYDDGGKWKSSAT
jgi:hypothetical protein